MQETPSSTFHKANQLKNQIDHLLQQFELGHDKSTATQQRLTGMTYEFERTVKQLEFVPQTVSASERGMWDRRLVKLKDDSKSFRESLEKLLGNMYRSQIEEDNRRRIFGDAEEKDRIDSAIKENKAWEESHNMIDQILAQGRSTLDSITRQNSVLKVL
eukprot:Platyproteum_vivax@DN5009_c0_g1_i2.p1